MTSSTMPIAMRNYIKRLSISMLLYFITLAFTVYMFNSGKASGMLGYVIGALPALPTIALFWTIGKLLSETKDEYRKTLFTRQILVATAFALSLATIWGFLEQFEMVFHIPAYYWSVTWFLGLFVGMAFNKITLGDV